MRWVVLPVLIVLAAPNAGAANASRAHLREQAAPQDTASASEDALRESFDRFVAAGRDLGQRTVDVVRDDTVNDQAKQAASSLNEALTATAEMIGRGVDGWFGRSSGGGAEPTVVGVPAGKA